MNRLPACLYAGVSLLLAATNHLPAATVNWSAVETGVVQTNDSRVVAGSLIRLGHFDISAALIASNAQDLAFLESHFTTFGTGFVGDGVGGTDGIWLAVTEASMPPALANQSIQVWVFDTPTAANALAQGIFTSTNSAWVFPDDSSFPLNLTTIDLSQANGLIVGSTGPTLDVGGTPLPTLRLAARPGATLTPPAAPSLLVATGISHHEVTLTWQDNAGTATAFAIERGPSATGPWTQTNSVAGDLTSYLDTNVTACTTYFYRVRATNSAGPSAYSNVDGADTSCSIAIVIKGTARSGTFADGDGDTITVSLKGAGDLAVYLNAQQAIDDLVVTGADAASSLAVKVQRAGDGVVTAHHLHINGSLKSFKAKALNLDAGDLTMDGSLGGLTVGHIRDFAIALGGSLGKVSALTMTRSTMYAGYAPADPDAPMAGGSFTDGLSIDSVKLKGVTGVAAYTASVIAAETVGKISLPTVATDNDGQAFGVLADLAIGGVTVMSPSLNWDPSGAPQQGAGDFLLAIGGEIPTP